MAATSESATAGGRSRSSSNIVFAGDRTVSRRVAHRHSRRVRLLKLALPMVALSTLGLFLLIVLNGTGIGPEVPTLQIPQIVADNLKMKNPHYEGFNADGGHYWVRAETAQQDLKSLTLVHLEGITGDLVDAKKQKTHLVATRGVFDNKANTLELHDSIRVTGDSGLDATLTRATIRTKEGIISSDQPSTITMGAGTILSNQFTIRQKTKEYAFVENVRTHMKTKEQGAAAVDVSGQKPLPFGKPGEPVEVTSNRLDVDDTKKSAQFTGNVVAAQGGATLSAPEMTVSYEGDVTPKPGDGAASAKPDGPGTRVTTITARDSVTLEQASGETATSQTAHFDATTQVAVLEGDVVLTQGDDKTAVGDRAEYDQAAQTMVLSGPVVVTQGANVLKGRRLVFNRANNKMQLTAPTDATTGRISAHFVKPAQKAAKSSEDESEQSTGGIPFGPAFKTDPNAPYDVTSERLDVDDNAKIALFTGDVITLQGNFTIRSGEMTAHYSGRAGLSSGDEGGKSAAASLTLIRAKKNVSVISKDGQKATGDWAEVNVKTNLATLGGSVVLTQGKNIVKGNKLLIDLNTGEATIKTEPPAGNSKSMVSAGELSSSDGVVKLERPSAVFYPGQMLGKKQKPGGSGIDGWQSRTSP